MADIKYAPDKPKECRYCYYWQGKFKGCQLGEQNCAYIIHEKHDAPKSRCTSCPYGKHSPCIGWCMVDVMNSVREKKKAASGNRA